MARAAGPLLSRPDAFPGLAAAPEVLPHPIAGQTLVKRWSKPAKRWPNAGQTLVNRWSNGGRTVLVNRWSIQSSTPFDRWSNARQAPDAADREPRGTRTGRVLAELPFKTAELRLQPTAGRTPVEG
jgi:hypothetical protein